MDQRAWLDCTYVDELGLRCLWPSESSSPEQDLTAKYAADIVLVHGLAGGSITSFLHENGAFWPRWLASVMPDIRILSFGYPVHETYLEHNVASQSHSRSFTFAESLLLAIKDSRKQSTRPIIFIAHGIGGIVVKKALVYSVQRRALYGDIAQSVCHVMFLDTPHRGYDLRAWTTVFGGLANDRARAEFGLSSEQLADLTATFSEIGNKISVTSCYASEPTVVEGCDHVLIQESSIRLGFETEKVLLLPKTCHATMCKFASDSDHNYRSIKERLLTEMHDLAHKKALVSPNDPPSSTDEHWSHAVDELSQAAISQLRTINEHLVSNAASIEKLNAQQKAVIMNATKHEKGRELVESNVSRRKILKWLYPPKQGIDYESVLSTELKELNGSTVTCSWIETDPIFQQWHESSASKVFWMHGIQGCGKTTLLSWLIQSFRTKSKNVFFFHCSADTARSGCHILSCIAHQMASKADGIPKSLTDRYERSSFAFVNTMTTAVAILKEVADVFDLCFIFIDALDECDDRDTLILALLDLAESRGSRFRIICSSRDEFDILRRLKDNPSVVDLEMSQAKVQSSINHFIEMSVRSSHQLAQKLEGHPEAQQFVIDQLISGSQGMFLLPKFMLQDLALKGTFEDIKKFVEIMPDSLSEYYRRILTRLDPAFRPLAKQIILWVVWTKRPLSLAELSDMFAHEGSKYLSLRSDIKKALGCLISLHDDRVRYSHSSVKRFFLEAHGQRHDLNFAGLFFDNPRTVLADACARYILRKKHDWPSPDHRFGLESPDRVRRSSPFLEYASAYWLVHCREAPKPLRYLHDVRQFFESRDLLKWYEVMCIFAQHEGPTAVLRQFRQWLLVLSQLFELDTPSIQLSLDEAQGLLGDLNYIRSKLAKLEEFARQWETTLICFPSEIWKLAPLIDSPNRSVHETEQSFLSTLGTSSTESKQIFNLLDRRQLSRAHDRFILTDMNVLQWHSLMPSSATDNMLAAHYDPSLPECIELQSQSIETATTYKRQGIDPAEVGSITNTAVLRKDLRAAALTWARHLEDKSRTLEIKTYAWILEEDSSSYVLHQIDWTDFVDPCRVDLTVSDAFRFSKGPAAFTDDLQTLWTPGGAYNIITGAREHPPAVFYDQNMRSMTFSRNARIVAGIKSAESLVVFSIPEGEQVTSWSGTPYMLGVSPKGMFVLFIETCEADNQARSEQKREEHVTLLRSNGDTCRLWSWQPPDNSEDNIEAEVLSLTYFYNNGGLTAFSDNESALVLCVPTAPEWQLLAFDLTSSDIASSQWKVDYSCLLGGASILSLSFCPLYDQRLYVLDNYGILSKVEISKKSASSILTTDTNENPPVIVAVSRRRKQMITIVMRDLFKQEGIELKTWDLKTLTRKPYEAASPSFVWSLSQIRSQELTINFESIFDCLALPRSLQPAVSDWQHLGQAIQNRIDDAIKAVEETMRDSDDSSDGAHRHLTPRVLTEIGFSTSSFFCFALSVIYYPVFIKNGQARWSMSVVMDVRRVDKSLSIPVYLWDIGTVGNPYEEHMCMACHEPSRTLAFAASTKFYDKSDKSEKSRGTNFYVAKLCVVERFQDLEGCADGKSVDDVANSCFKIYDIPMVSSLLFSKCGRFLYGISASWPSSVFQIDLKRRSVVRTVYDPFNCDGQVMAMSLTTYGDDVFVVGIDTCVVVLCRLPFRPGARLEKTAIAVGPNELASRTHLEIIWPECVEDDVVVIARAKSFLRGHESALISAAAWPIVMAFKERHIGQWTPLEERRNPQEAAEAEDVDTKDDARSGNATSTTLSTLALAGQSLEDYAGPRSIIMAGIILTCLVIGLHRWRTLRD